MQIRKAQIGADLDVEGDNMERTLTVTITADSPDEYTVEIMDGESGDCASKTFDGSDHWELDNWVGAEIYGWVDYMMEGLECGEE